MNPTKSCPRCGAGLSAPEELQGLCAACVLVAALGAERAEAAASSDLRRPAPALAELAPHFPDLELVELVGQGGMGAVFRVRQTKLGREAALKVLSLDAEATPAFGERFEREARTLASLDHENIVHVYDAGRAGPWWYLLMEFVDGVSLRQMIRAREVDPRTALALVAQVCDALQCAHDHGVVHRDIKPENVLVDRRGRVKVLDFGLAKLLGREPRTGTLTETGQVMGTPRYMAPEQWERPLSVDHRADIYAVGVVFYELLTGELPIGAFALPSQKGAPDARVDPVVMKTLAKEPERRYQHASEVRADVQRIESTPPPLARAAAAPRKSRTGLWVALGAAGCLLLVAVPFSLVFFLSAGMNATQRAARQAEDRQVALAQAAQRAALASSKLVQADLRRDALAAAAGPAPTIDRDAARASGWNDEQLDVGDALCDLAWFLNLERARAELLPGKQGDPAVRFRIPANPDLLQAHERLVRAVSEPAANSVSTQPRDGRRVVTAYTFTGPGYSVAADESGELAYWIDPNDAELLRAIGHAPGLGVLGAWSGLDAAPRFGAEDWTVSVELGGEPHGWFEVGGKRTELGVADLQGRYRYLLHLARELASSSPSPR
ncbi:MAG: serine/threonine-protein kinase [Planctomycetota bacterium]